MSDGLLPGFSDAVFGAQGCFRAILAALSEPGTVHALGGDLAPPAPLCPAAAAVVLTLADPDASLVHDAGPVADAFLRFHTGAPEAELATASFVLATGAMPPLAALTPGTDEIPSAGATLVVQVESIEEGEGWTLSGPGIDGLRRLKVTGLPDDFPAQWAANHARFPRGVDVILCAGDRLAGLPRSVTLAVTLEA
ncbi:alpha-D-ribose 1-methylphosphonate 5-triphosphate synthase subunit PhnH [Humitalea rosea]|uniref:Alpha-D-ribose 1-methylphosphonate 5-triphosphate synthase subunit PhnH n=1 Tax=Humitalea rosea TaxID=990373 RepID=A0A2W7ITN5_9PROT|nr:phosphonate C-P lyase system protein PhnH [Humitalea rosea]PZW50874.1 alpha-D-ribose 1-methylphosphonate 5-triphosphate synthase subunit PhnH [Humitalea rosea]